MTSRCVISDIFAPALRAEPGRSAVTTRSGTVSYAEIHGLADHCAAALRARGIRAGDRVAACLPNDIDIVVAFHATMRLGAIWVGVNQALARPEKEYILADSGSKLLLADSATAEEIGSRNARTPQLSEIITVSAHRSVDSWRATVDAQDDGFEAPRVDPHAPAAIAYTSGTTGYPKGVVHSQYGLVTPGAHLVATRRYDKTLRKGDCFPLTIINMLVLTTLLTAQAEGLAVIMDSLKADVIADWIERERVTVWNGPPPVLHTMAHDTRIQPGALQTLREVWSGGADCPETIRDAFETKFGIQIRGTFGQTEAPTVITIERPGVQHAPGSSGIPLPHLELTIRDADDQILETGEVGEICVASRDADEIATRLQSDWGITPSRDEPSLPAYLPMLGYWNNPEASAVACRGGVLRTGDAGALDADGNLVVSDRLNLVLNRGGANVYPAEIERVVMQFSPVESCGVLGIPDERLGERVGMLVQFKPGQKPDVNALLAHCRDELARYKVPEFVALVDSLPRNAMGKIDRRALSKAGQQILAEAECVTDERQDLADRAPC